LHEREAGPIAGTFGRTGQFIRGRARELRDLIDFAGYCDNWDKLDNYICTTGAPTALVCDAIMLGVRVLPPLNIADLVPHRLIA
jgi:hypothetical protein